MIAKVTYRGLTLHTLAKNKDTFLNIEPFKPFKDSVRGRFHKGGKPLENTFCLR